MMSNLYYIIMSTLYYIINWILWVLQGAEVPFGIDDVMIDITGESSLTQ